MYKLMIAVLGATLFLAACEDPAANMPKATVSNMETNTVAKSQANAANTANTAKSEPGKVSFVITPENSKVGFIGSKVTGKHEGGFKQFMGSIDVIDGKATASKVVVTIEIASVFTDADGLTEHLQTGDFFDVKSFPKATFVSTKIEADAAKGGDNYNVTGEMELRGQKKSVTFPAKISITDSAVNVTADFAINRKDFGIVYAGKADDLIRDDVAIKLELKADKIK